MIRAFPCAAGSGDDNPFFPFSQPRDYLQHPSYHPRLVPDETPEPLNPFRSIPAPQVISSNVDIEFRQLADACIRFPDPDDDDSPMFLLECDLTRWEPTGRTWTGLTRAMQCRR
jgi:hypothetical protein